MWVVLPPSWHGFQHKLAGEFRARYVYLAEPASSSEETAIVGVQLPYDVADQDVLVSLAIE